MTTTISLGVDGMTCEGCENSVQFALNGLDGVDLVKADHQAKTVRVDYNPDTIDETALGEAIEAMGYTLLAH